MSICLVHLLYSTHALCSFSSPISLELPYHSQVLFTVKHTPPPSSCLHTQLHIAFACFYSCPKYCTLSPSPLTHFYTQSPSLSVADLGISKFGTPSLPLGFRSTSQLCQLLCLPKALHPVQPNRSCSPKSSSVLMLVHLHCKPQRLCSISLTGYSCAPTVLQLELSLQRGESLAEGTDSVF